MKKLLYTILSIASVIYIGFLIVNIIRQDTSWQPWDPASGFETFFNLVVRFGGVAIIFCFALVNFAGSPNIIKTIFFIILIVVIIVYIIVLAAPNFIFGLFGGNNANAEAIARAFL